MDLIAALDPVNDPDVVASACTPSVWRSAAQAAGLSRAVPHRG